ncbi:glycerol-3-phosphate 1-O-acyltransferase PlsY [Chitinimonas sp. BJB300]|uniref:glycerol-3-phosphate 1-O-acyltransferase PlsY n=1 Tax=Chitinimonas sp. BJB300 TaxID=1559339 RepID=UPI000C0F390F|nr:glycerol-3-phosphate 1-O-acyltransferase PlsY [Chitinimonas sp. BJB300]PHV12582.1 acyl-phosphate glycerol 3-phosphate acyltransferase [Chitinimonas sp. BJB300]TSJ90025.1 glycerol-3-phosphate 1-O-acyltransferase PlsY [Chitinimonas sp. BJB300]
MPPAVLPFVLVIAAYLIGSISFAIIVSRTMKMADPRSYGSGNPGATNVLRSGRKKAALFTLLGDTLKGLLAVAVAQQLGVAEEWIAAVAIAVIVGHMWPIFFRFQGGKGVATAAGVLLTLDWKLGLAVLTVWFLVALITRLSSLAAILAAISAPLLCHFLVPDHPAIFGAVLAIAALLVQRHKRNLINLLGGTEGKIGQSAKAND